MMSRLFVRGLVTVVILVGIALSRPASGQITTETASGTVKDEQGLPVPGATVTLSVARFIKIGSNRRFEMRIDAFNALNTVTITGVNTVLQVRSLTDPTPTNLSRDGSGNLINPTGFGTVTAVAPARQIQLMALFHF